MKSVFYIIDNPEIIYTDFEVAKDKLMENQTTFFDSEQFDAFCESNIFELFGFQELYKHCKIHKLSLRNYKNQVEYLLDENNHK